MIMAPSITPTEQSSNALKSFMQRFRTMLTKQGPTSYDHESAMRDWDALQQCAPFTEEGRERRATIARIMQSADVATRKSIADLLLFADDINEALETIVMPGQQPEVA
jgi:hypothetical protein